MIDKSTAIGGRALKDSNDIAKIIDGVGFANRRRPQRAQVAHHAVCVKKGTHVLVRVGPTADDLTLVVNVPGVGPGKLQDCVSIERTQINQLAVAVEKGPVLRGIAGGALVLADNLSVI